MLAIDGVGFDWSDMAEEQVQTNMALIAFSDSEVYTDKSCSKTCLKNYETLKKQCDDLIVKLNETEFKAATYKRGLATVEDQLLTYKKNEVLFSEKIDVLKREVGCKDYEISVLKTEYEKVKQEKEGIDFKIAKFDKSAKSLDEMLQSQITDKSKKGLGYNVVPLPHPLIYNRPTKLDLSYLGLDEFKELEFNGYGPRDTGLKSTIVCNKESDNSEQNTNDSLEKDQVSDIETSSVESPLKVDKEIIIDWKENFFHPVNHVESLKPKNNEKPVKKTVRVDHDYYAKTSHPSSHRNMTPRVVLLKSGLKPLSTARPVYSAHPKPTVHCARPLTHFSKQAQTTVQRPFYKKPALTNRYVNHKVNTVRPRVVNTARPYTTPVNTVRANGVNDVKPSTCWIWRPTRPNGASLGKLQMYDKGFVDSGCSRHMTGNIAYLSNFKEFDGGHVTFGGGAYGGRISGKGTLKTDNLDFNDVYVINELNFNLFSVSHVCDKKNFVLFIDTECLVLSPNFKLPDESQVLLKIPRKDNMYSFDLKNIVPKESLTCLVAKATSDESMLWHRRLGHINFKNINKLVEENLVRGLPLKRFENDQTCVACLKGKQHRASCKSKVLNPITKPLFMLHMDLFGPTFVSSLMHKKYCLVVTDDYSRFTWVFFLATKDETSEILKNFIKEIENLVDKKVKIIRCDNGTEFKNKVMDDFCREKGIRREFSVAKTPQQNRVAERRNRTLIEAARTMLADSKLPTTFWAEAVSTACYVQNRVLIVKPHNKTPYELFRGFKPALSFMKPFGCHVTILNTLDHLGKFDGKSDDGFFVGYSLSSKSFRVYNTRTRKVEENLHVGFLENKPMIEGNGPKWLFDIDSLTQSMNYVPVTACTCTNESADASYFDSPLKDVGNDEPKSADDERKVQDGPNDENDDKDKLEDDSSLKEDNTAEPHVNTASPEINTGSSEVNTVVSPVNTTNPEDVMGPSHSFEDTHLESFNHEDEQDVDLGNILNSYAVPTTPHTRIHKDHPFENVIGDMQSLVQTRRMKEPILDHGFLSVIYEGKNHRDLHTCLFACFLSQEEPKRISKALSDPDWIEAMQDELLQNKKDERGIVIRNKARLVAQGHTQEEGIDYDEVFAHVARIKAIRLFLAYASFMGFMVYQMDVKSAFLYGQIEEEVYVCQLLGFEDLDYLNKVYKGEKALYGLHQAPRAWYETLAKKTYSTAFTKLILKVKKLEKQVKSGKARRRARIVLSEDEDALEDSSKQGRKIYDIDEDLNISLVQDEGVTWVQDADTKIQEKVSDETELVLKEEIPTELVEDQGSGEKGEKEVTTPTNFVLQEEIPTELVKDQGNGEKGEKEVTTPKNFQTYVRQRRGVSTGNGRDSTASRQVSTADIGTVNEVDAATAKEKDKGKAVMTEPEPEKKTKLKERQERAGLVATIKLQEQLEEEEKQRLARDAKIAKRLYEEITVGVNQETLTQSKQSEEREKFIDWNDPSVLRYHALKLKPVSVAQARKNMITFLKNLGGYKDKEKKSVAEQEESAKEEDVKPEQIVKEVCKKSGGKRIKSLARKMARETEDEETSKKQKFDEKEAADYEKEKEELRMWLTVVLDEEEIMDPEILHSKADGNTSYHKTFESMLRRFDRQDLVDLHRLVMQRFKDITPEGYNLMLWGDLKTMFEPNAEHEVWSNQQDWTLISWKLYENCGVHTLLLDGTLISFHMLVEKKYPFTKEILEKMLN
ncbi:putative ribonuclease H-like domain-containing protein [Tanacetum coccineum]